MPRDLPNPPESGILNAIRFGYDTFRFLQGIQSRFRDLAAVPIPGGAPLVVVTNPDLAYDALSRPAEFRRVPAMGAAALIAERGLVQSEGDLWEQQREIMAPAFAGKQVWAYGNTVGERVDDLTDDWDRALADRPGVTAAGPGPATLTDGSGCLERDLHRETTSLTIRIATEILLGEDIGRERADQFHEWMQVAGEEFEFGIDAVTPDWVPERISGEFREAADGILGLAEEMIERRRAELDDSDGPADMLTMLLRAEDRADVHYPENQIRDEVATFLIAGHETTALSLTYTMTLLSWHPDVRERVRDEACEVLGDETPRYEHVSDLEYTGRVFQESLRLYPAAWAVFRRATADVRLGDYLIPEGSAVVIPQWSIHRDPRYFDDPETFDPDRWADRNPASVDAYFPFSSGPHACIGRQFSLTGARLALAAIARDFDVEVPEGALSDLHATPTLRPGGAVPATIRRAE